VHTQSQELVDVRIKAKEDGDQISGLYAKSQQESKRIWEEAQKKAKNAEREWKVAERRLKKDLEWKLKEFTIALQTKLSDERLKKSVGSIVWSVLTLKEGDTKPNEKGYRL
jgi:F0F1-type ATP synthase membrane subunit b/b'